MQAPETPPDEAERLAALRQLELLDTPPEARFDRLTEAAAKALGTGAAMVSLVDESRQWFKSRVGVEAQETPRAVSFCGHAILGEETFVVEDAAGDPRFHDNPLVTGAMGARFYAGHPLTTLDGRRVGTLCVVDRAPRTLSPRERAALRELAAAASDELSAQRVKLGSYRLLEVIGRGGMGVVYLAHDEGLARTVAVKVVLRDHAQDPRFLERFRREGRALAAVSHPNVMTAHAMGEERGIHYIVFEHLPGGTLLQRIRRQGPLAPAFVAGLGAQLASALQAIHEAGLVHRDVKPANVLFTARELPKLGDFGLARAAGTSPGGTARIDRAILAALVEREEREASLRAVTLTGVRAGATATLAGDGLTLEGAIVGTAATMAPEQAREGASIDGRADLYGLGATLYQALVGQPPWSGSVREVLERVLSDDPAPPLRERAPQVPPGLAAVVHRLLDKDPARRGSAAAAEAALRQASGVA